MTYKMKLIAEGLKDRSVSFEKGGYETANDAARDAKLLMECTMTLFGATDKAKRDASGELEVYRIASWCDIDNNITVLANVWMELVRW